VRAHLESRQQAKQHKDWQRRHQRGKPPVAERIVNLRPGNGQPSVKLDRQGVSG
jgi:hypothetical protein